MSNKNFLLYGANGFTGVLIAKLAAEYGLQPTLAGRNEKAIQALAKELQLPYQIVDLTNANALRNPFSVIVQAF
jgi:short subunit dehydrogenase-like uncharacterized protein